MQTSEHESRGAYVLRIYTSNKLGHIKRNSRHTRAFSSPYAINNVATNMKCGPCNFSSPKSTAIQPKNIMSFFSKLGSYIVIAYLLKSQECNAFE